MPVLIVITYRNEKGEAIENEKLPKDIYISKLTRYNHRVIVRAVNKQVKERVSPSACANPFFVGNYLVGKQVYFREFPFKCFGVHPMRGTTFAIKQT